MTPDPDAVASIIREVAEAIVLPRFQRLAAHEITEKKAGDIVTVADEEAERALEAALLSLLPGAGVVGEEAVSVRPSILSALGGDGPVWVIDPVDGTQNFADGNPRFAMIVALVRAGRTVAGWIHEPITDTTVWAVRGEGAYEKGARLRLDAPAGLSQFVGSLNRRHRKRLERADALGGGEMAKSAVRYRCVGAEYADLARGTLHFARYGGHLKPWDHAAGVLIHREAGGYDAIVGTGASYRPGPTLDTQILQLTPDRESWQQLVELLGD